MVFLLVDRSTAPVLIRGVLGIFVSSRRTALDKRDHEGIAGLDGHWLAHRELLVGQESWPVIAWACRKSAWTGTLPACAIKVKHRSRRKTRLTAAAVHDNVPLMAQITVKNISGQPLLIGGTREWPYGKELKYRTTNNTLEWYFT